MIMPLYEMECPHHHRFERLCSIAEREDLVPCEKTVESIVIDQELLVKYAHPAVLPNNMQWGFGSGQDEPILVETLPCQLQARMVITHTSPGGMLDHNLAANRDAAREGRYDPANPSRRFMAKGRGWRR